MTDACSGLYARFSFSYKLLYNTLGLARKQPPQQHKKLSALEVALGVATVRVELDARGLAREVADETFAVPPGPLRVSPVRSADAEGQPPVLDKRD